MRLAGANQSRAIAAPWRFRGKKVIACPFKRYTSVFELLLSRGSDYSHEVRKGVVVLARNALRIAVKR